MAVEEGVADDYTQDGTVDLKGNPVHRSKRGAWKACSFIIVYEVLERMAFYGISSNLEIYLSTRLRQGIVNASNHVTNWVGVVWMTPVLGAYVADAYLDRFWTFLISSAVYLLPATATSPPQCSLTSISVHSTLSRIGIGGTKPNISTIGAGQFDDFHPKEKSQKISFFNWWMFGIFFGAFLANIILVYIQDNIGWTLGYGLPTAGLAIATAIFVAGIPFYRHNVPAGSPFTRMAKVIVAAINNWKLPLPREAKELYEWDLEEYTKKKKFRMEPTPTLSFLNKASIRTGSTHPWQLSTVTEVEETKQMIRMIPILFATFVPSIMLAQVNTLFIKQGTTLYRKVGNFSIPPASLIAFVNVSLLVSIVLYDRIFVKIMRKFTKNPRGITLLQRMGTGIVIHALIMFVSCLVERRRLAAARKHGVVESGGQVPLSIFILLPQFILMGIANVFMEVSKVEFFYNQAPESMKSLGTSYSSTSIGVGNFLSSVLLKSVSNISSRHGGKGWIINNLNTSHLDYYYAFFAILNCLNFIFFLVVSKYYVYKAELSDSKKLLTESCNESNNPH
ncbi:Protein NRT1/ PTR FAMILY 5.2, partial [Cucurbita argyrosperma subsp. sororia]